MPAPPELLAHLAEEREQPLGFLLAAGSGAARSPTRRDARRPRSRHAPGRSSSLSTTRATATQLAYLFERSPFYREKLTAAGFRSADAAGGLADIAQLPLTEKNELKATASRDNPFGAHLCADPSEIVRIYSTSGTTGDPSYIPLTSADLENWVTASARSYAASGVTAGQRIVTTYNAGPFVAGAALLAFDRIGLCHIPVGTGNSERLHRRGGPRSSPMPWC